MTIVIGAGISGLFASTVLCKHGHQITLLDQDNSEERKKINQRFHVHTCMAYCAQWLDKYLPEFREIYFEAGGIAVNWGKEILNVTDGYVGSSFNDPDMFSYFSTRNLLEKCILKTLLTKYQDQITFKSGCRVKDLVWKDNQVCGVKLNKEEMLDKLVIDCRGANTTSFKNLPEYQIEEYMDIGCHYSSAIFVGPKLIMGKYKTYMARRTGNDIIYFFPAEQEAYQIYKMEEHEYKLKNNERLWVVSKGGIVKGSWNCEHYQQASTIITNMKRITQWTNGYNNKWWFRLRNHCPGFLEFGDRNIRIVPTYGSGMTLCAKQASFLDTCLSQNKLDQYADLSFRELKRSWTNYQGILVDRHGAKYTGRLIKPPKRLDSWKRESALQVMQTNASITNTIIRKANLLESQVNLTKFQQYYILLLGLYFTCLNFFKKFFATQPIQYDWSSFELPVHRLKTGLAYLRSPTVDNNKEVTVYLHGFPENAFAWLNQLQTKDHCDKIAFFLPGYAPSISVTVDNKADQISTVVQLLKKSLDELQVTKIKLIGHDWGGIISYFFAHTYPEMIDSLHVISAPHPVLYLKQATWKQYFMSWYILAFQIPYLGECLANFFIRKLAHSKVGHQSYLANQNRCSQLLAYYRCLFQTDYSILKNGVNFPISVTHNQYDKYISEQVSVDKLEEIYQPDNLQVHKVKKKGHFYKEKF